MRREAQGNGRIQGEGRSFCAAPEDGHRAKKEQLLVSSLRVLNKLPEAAAFHGDASQEDL